MGTKIEWQDSDFAAQQILAEVMKESGLSYRAIEQRTGGTISFVRFRDIAVGRRAPVRLTEFLLICEACHADPIATLRDIIEEARRIAADRAHASPAPDPDSPAVRRARALEKLRRNDTTLAANHSPYKYDTDPDTDDIA